MNTLPRIAIIGAGNVGANLGVNLSRQGFPLRFGVLDPEKVKDVLARCENRAEAVTVEAAGAWADVVFLTVPASAAVQAGRALGDMKGKVLVDCTNAVGWNEGPVLTPAPEGSTPAALVKAFPGLRVVKGFSTFGAQFHLDPQVNGVSVDVPLAGDDVEAKALVASIATKAGFTPLDVGPLRNAAHLEGFAVLAMHLASKGGQGRDTAFKLLKGA